MTRRREQQDQVGRDLNDSEGGQNSEKKKYDEILNLLYTDPSKPSSFSSAANLYLNGDIGRRCRPSCDLTLNIVAHSHTF